MDDLAVGVVGVGHLGRHHARIYTEIDGVELVGIVDADPERANTVAQQHGCRVFDSPEALASEVQAASVAVPTEAHAQVSLPMLAAGVDLLIEKPLARTLAEADAIVQAAQDAQAIAMVGHTERFNPALQAMAEFVDGPRFFEIHRLAAFSARSTDIDVVLDLMIHDLDLVLALDGTEPAAVSAVGIDALTDKVDIANARLEMTSGCVANITASRISAEALRRIRVFQPRTYLSCDTGGRTAERYHLSLPDPGQPRIVHQQLPVADTEPLRNELESFVDSVRQRSSPPIDALQGRRVLALAQRVLDEIDLQRNRS